VSTLRMRSALPMRNTKPRSLRFLFFSVVIDDSIWMIYPSASDPSASFVSTVQWWVNHLIVICYRASDRGRFRTLSIKLYLRNGLCTRTVQYSTVLYCTLTRGSPYLIVDFEPVIAPSVTRTLAYESRSELLRLRQLM
jgi:hypothetical protein